MENEIYAFNDIPPNFCKTIIGCSIWFAVFACALFSVVEIEKIAVAAAFATFFVCYLWEPSD